ncbi:MAG: futalosine hydrolase [Bacteroidales bacterium]|nr:futalosine hydrolase [Bacteroidales bacterium]
MSNIVLITAATDREMECLDRECVGGGSALNLSKGVEKLITGIGPVSATYAIMNYLLQNKSPRLIVNIGIAGSFREYYVPGTVLLPAEDRFADLGVADGDKFIPLEQAGLTGSDDKLSPAGSYYPSGDIMDLMPLDMPRVKALTVSTATGSAGKRDQLLSAFDADVETMEGAAVYYVCSNEGIPCIGIRAVSNMVGPRDKTKWDIPLALNELGKAAGRILAQLI